MEGYFWSVIGDYFQKHGTTSKPLKAVRLDTEEQEKIAKSGLEMKLITSEMDAETDKWQESNTQVEVGVSGEKRIYIFISHNFIPKRGRVADRYINLSPQTINYSK